MTPKDRAAIRRLDIAWAHERAGKMGMPFVASQSQFTGRRDTADGVALLSLHKLRVHVGNKKEAKASREWLAEHGVASVGLLEDLVPVQ